MVRCTNCDIKVSKFNNARWDKSVDYLFFRNFYSNKSELSKVIFIIIKK